MSFYELFRFVVLFSSAFAFNKTETISFGNCIISALRPLENIDGNFIHIFSHDGNLNGNLFHNIAHRSNQSFIISNKIIKFFNEYYRRIPSAYVIFTPSLHHLRKLFDVIDVSHYNWYPRQRIVVVFTETVVSSNERLIAEDIVIILNDYDITDVLILLNSKHSTRAYTWFPFSARNHCRTRAHVTLLDECGEKRPIFRKNLYPTKIPQKFTGCVFTMGGFHWPPYVYYDNITKNFSAGYNYIALNLLAEKHNLTLKYASAEEGSRWGSQLDNGTWTGGLGLLQRSTADISTGGSLMTIMRMNTFDCSTTYNSIYMKFYLVLPSKLPHWKNMIDIFSTQFWSIIVAVYLIISFIMYFVSNLNKKAEKLYYRRLSNTFLILWGVAFGNSTNCIPKSQAVRIIFFLWLIYNFHITLVYTSSLLSFITKPAYEDPIRTLKQLSRTDLKIVMVKQFAQISSKMDEDFRALLASKTDPQLDHIETIEEMLKRKDVVVLDTADHFEIFAKDKLNKVYSLDDFVRLNPCLYLRKGSVFLKYVDHIQLDVYENGMFQKLMEDYRDLRKNEKLSRNSYNEVLPLMFQELSGSFYVLLFGLSLSIVTFFVEIIYKKIKM
ncbi:glutamate receptor 2-like [Planococcus citri]|uniref:glutamate receptor 2-like n=1 Tax=Planococcus citri TaxID=170843 RepID=UPI0031F9B5BE